jgi:hypothetical protein
MFRDSLARFHGPSVIRVSGNADRATLAAASRLLADFAFGIGDF